MNTRTLPSLTGAALCVLLMVGCIDDPVMPLDPMPALGVSNERELPIRGSLDLSVRHPDGSPIVVDPLPSVVCPAGFGRGSFKGTGILSHLGTVDYHATACSRVTGVTPPTVFVEWGSGKIVLTGANGDALVADIAGTSIVNVNCTASNDYELVLTVSEGSGRFASSQGSMDLTGSQVSTACPVGGAAHPGDVTFQVEGWISNVGR